MSSTWTPPASVCHWARHNISLLIWCPSVPPCAPAKVGRLRAGQLDRLCSSRWLDRVATNNFLPLNWLSPRTPVARDAAAIIRRPR